MSTGRNKTVDNIINQGGYFVAPNNLLSSSLSASAKLVYMYLLAQSEEFLPSGDHIVKGTDLSKNTVTKALKELNDAKLIHSQHSQNGAKCDHKMNPNFTFNSNFDLEVLEGVRFGLDDDQEPSQNLGCFDQEPSQNLGWKHPRNWDGSNCKTDTQPSQNLGWTIPEFGMEPSQKLGSIQEEQNETQKEGDEFSFSKNQSPSDFNFSKKEKIGEEKKDVPSFRTMVSLLQSQNGNKIPKPHELVPFVSSCKDQGLSVDDISVRVFSSVFFDSAKSLKKKVGVEKFNDWRESLENQLEQAKATVYFASSLNMNSEPEIAKGRIVINHRGESVLHEETFDDLFPNLIKE